MKNLVISIYHPDIKDISDRSLRDLLKSISKILRKAQVEEVHQLLRSIDISDAEHAQITGQLSEAAKTAPVYYFQELRRGSLVFEAAVGAAVIYLLKITVGETVKEIWKDIITQRIVGYLQKDRAPKFKECLEHQLDYSAQTFGKFSVQAVTLREEKDSDVVEVVLKTEGRFKKGLHERIDGAYVLKKLQEDLARKDKSGGSPP